MSVFYDHLVGLDEIHQELLDFDLSVKEHYYLLNLVDSTLHHEIVALCLDCLPREHHDYFLIKFVEDPANSDLLVFLRQNDPYVEEKIKGKSIEVKSKIVDDLRKVKKTKFQV
jgi:hypothetical protein